MKKVMSSIVAAIVAVAFAGVCFAADVKKDAAATPATPAAPAAPAAPAKK